MCNGTATRDVCGGPEFTAVPSNAEASGRRALGRPWDTWERNVPPRGGDRTEGATASGRTLILSASMSCAAPSIGALGAMVITERVVMPNAAGAKNERLRGLHANAGAATPQIESTIGRRRHTVTTSEEWPDQQRQILRGWALWHRRCSLECRSERRCGRWPRAGQED